MISRQLELLAQRFSHGGHDGDGGAYLRAPVGGEGVLGVLAQAVEGDEGGVEEEVSGNVSWTVSGEFEFGLERASTYKTYHAANLECARVVQYSSIERMVSFAASRHLNTPNSLCWKSSAHCKRAIRVPT